MARHRTHFGPLILGSNFDTVFSTTGIITFLWCFFTTSLFVVIISGDDMMVRKLLVDAEITRNVADYWKNEKERNPGNL